MKKNIDFLIKSNSGKIDESISKGSDYEISLKSNFTIYLQSWKTSDRSPKKPTNASILEC